MDKIVQKNNLPFPSLLCRSETKSSEVGTPIYEWEYLDEKGELKKNKTNLQEKIQSFERQTNYKLKIEKGEQIENGTGLYLDTSKLGSSYSDLDKYIGDIVNSLKQSISSQQFKNQDTKDNSQNTEIRTESKETAEQTVIGATETGGAN